MLVQAIRIPRDRGLVRVAIGVRHGNLLGQLPRHSVGLGIALNFDLRHLGNLVDRRRGGNNDLDGQVAVHRHALGNDAVAVRVGRGRNLGPCDLGLRRRFAVLHANGRLHALECLAHRIGRRALGNGNSGNRLNGRRNLGIALHDRNRALGLDRRALDRAFKCDVTQLAQGICRERSLIPRDGSGLRRAIRHVKRHLGGQSNVVGGSVASNRKLDVSDALDDRHQVDRSLDLKATNRGFARNDNARAIILDGEVLLGSGPGDLRVDLGSVLHRNLHGSRQRGHNSLGLCPVVERHRVNRTSQVIRNLTKRFDDLDGALRLLIRAGNRALNRNFTFLGKVLVGEIIGIPRYAGFGIGIVRVDRRDRGR